MIPLILIGAAYLIGKTMNDKKFNKGGTLYERDNSPIGYKYDTNKVARERFDFNKLEQIGKGSDRTVFSLDDDKVVKVAHSPRGMEQNRHEGDYGLMGIIPKVFEEGLNYVVTEKIQPIKSSDKVITYDMETQEEVGESTAGQMLKDLKKFSQRDFEMKTTELQNVLYKYGLNAIMDYDVLYNDFSAKRNWGYKDGMPIHVDAGTFGGTRMIQDYKGVKPLSDPDFRDVYYKSKQAKKQFKDKDKYTKFQNGGEVDVRLEYIDFDNESDDIDVYEADKAASKIAKDNSINILRDKNLKTVALDKDNNVIGALWTSIIGDEFSFDIAVDKSFQRKGVGEKLLKEAFAEYNAYDDEGNLKYNVDVVNPSMEKLLLKYGFVVSEIVMGHTIMIHPTNSPSIKE